MYVLINVLINESHLLIYIPIKIKVKMHIRNKNVIFSENFYYYFLDSEALLYQCQNIRISGRD